MIDGLLQVLVAVWIAELLACIILFVQAWRNPHGKEPASRWPDYIPDDFGGEPTGTHEWNGGRGYDPESCVDNSPGPYDRSDDYPGWGVPNGDTQPAADPARGDRGVGGEGP